MWRWGKWSDPRAVGDEPQPAVIGQRPEARMLQTHDARRAPFIVLFILKEDLHWIADPIGFNQALGHGWPPRFELSRFERAALYQGGPSFQQWQLRSGGCHHTGT
jgi:hypothetical protein